MQVAFLILSDHSESLNGKLYAMGAGWNVLAFPELPHDFGFSIGIGLDVPWHLTDEMHELQVRVDDPDGGALGEPFQLGFETGRPPESPSGQDQRMVLSLATRIRFETAGPHAVVAGVNGDELARSRFYVVRSS